MGQRNAYITLIVETENAIIPHYIKNPDGYSHQVSLNKNEYAFELTPNNETIYAIIAVYPNLEPSFSIKFSVKKSYQYDSFSDFVSQYLCEIQKQGPNNLTFIKTTGKEYYAK